MSSFSKLLVYYIYVHYKDVPSKFMMKFWNTYLIHLNCSTSQNHGISALGKNHVDLKTVVNVWPFQRGQFNHKNLVVKEKWRMLQCQIYYYYFLFIYVLIFSEPSHALHNGIGQYFFGNFLLHGVSCGIHHSCEWPMNTLWKLPLYVWIYRRKISAIPFTGSPFGTRFKALIWVKKLNKLCPNEGVDTYF